MPFPSKKRKSAAPVQDDDSCNEDVSAKRGKAASGHAFQPASQIQVDSDGNRYWEISKARRVTISDFKGTKLVNIREYYQKDNEWLPGKKGISMSLEQYSAFVNVMPQIERVLKKQGENVPRPDYSGNGAEKEDPSNGPEDDDDDGQIDSRKANIEATSDEEED